MLGILLLLALGAGATYGGLLWWIVASESRWIANAERRLDEGKPREAREALAWLLWLEPDHPQALLLVGRSHAAERNFSEAVEWFDRVPNDAPERLPADMHQVRALLGDARFEEAEPILVRRRDDRAAYEELRWLYFNQLRRREVERLLDERLARHPDDGQVLVDFLYTEFRKQIAEEGIATLQRIHEHQPGQPSIILALGYCHWRLGDVGTAWKYLKQASRLRPNHLETRLVTAEFLLERGELDAAEELLGDGPSNDVADAASVAGDRVAGDRGDAGSIAHAHGPRSWDDDRWWWLRCRLARRRGETAQALELAEQALKRRPHELPYVHGYAQLLHQAGRTDDAIQAMQQARELEACKSRLEELVLSEALERLTPQLCLELAALCECRGRTAQAAGWRRLAARAATARN